MGLGITLYILSLMFLIGDTYGTPICGPDDPRILRDSMSYEFMVEKYGRDPRCTDTEQS